MSKRGAVQQISHETLNFDQVTEKSAAVRHERVSENMLQGRRILKARRRNPLKTANEQVKTIKGGLEFISADQEETTKVDKKFSGFDSVPTIINTAFKYKIDNCEIKLGAFENFKGSNNINKISSNVDFKRKNPFSDQEFGKVSEAEDKTEIFQQPITIRSENVGKIENKVTNAVLTATNHLFGSHSLENNEDESNVAPYDEISGAKKPLLYVSTPKINKVVKCANGFKEVSPINFLQTPQSDNISLKSTFQYSKLTDINKTTEIITPTSSNISCHDSCDLNVESYESGNANSKIKKLNSSIYKWLGKRINSYPYANYTPAFKEYISYIDNIMGSKNSKNFQVEEEKHGEEVESEKQVIVSSRNSIHDDNKDISSYSDKTGVVIANEKSEACIEAASSDKVAILEKVTDVKKEKEVQNKLVDSLCTPEFDITEEGSHYNERSKFFYMNSENKWENRGKCVCFLKKCVKSQQLIIRSYTELAPIILNVMCNQLKGLSKQGKSTIAFISVFNPPLDKNTKKPYKMLLKFRNSEISSLFIENINL